MVLGQLAGKVFSHFSRKTKEENRRKENKKEGCNNTRVMYAEQAAPLTSLELIGWEGRGAATNSSDAEEEEEEEQ